MRELSETVQEARKSYLCLRCNRLFVRDFYHQDIYIHRSYFDERVTKIRKCNKCNREAS